MTSEWQEKLVEKQVTYTLNLNGKMIILENVPARVNEETGEQFFLHLLSSIYNRQLKNTKSLIITSQFLFMILCQLNPLQWVCF